MIAIDAAFLVILVAGVMACVAAVVGRRQNIRASRDQMIGSSVSLWRITRRMAHILEGLLLQDANFPKLTEVERSSIESVLKEWEKQL